MEDENNINKLSDYRIERDYSKCVRHIKEEIFKLALEMNEQALIACDAANGGVKPIIEEADKKAREAYDNMIWRVQDYEDVVMYRDLGQDIDFNELNFKDYKDLKWEM